MLECLQQLQDLMEFQYLLIGFLLLCWKRCDFLRKKSKVYFFFFCHSKLIACTCISQTEHQYISALLHLAYRKTCYIDTFAILYHTRAKTLLLIASPAVYKPFAKPSNSDLKMGRHCKLGKQFDSVKLLVRGFDIWGFFKQNQTNFLSIFWHLWTSHTLITTCLSDWLTASWLCAGFKIGYAGCE